MIDLNQMKKKIETLDMKKLALIFIAGILLIVISFPTSTKRDESIEATTAKNQSSSTDLYVKKQEDKLKKALKKVEGVGKVEVMITLKSSTEEIVNKDTPYEKNTKEDEETIKEDEETVLIEEDGNQIPYVVKTVEPEVEGVVVVAQGGGNDMVNQNIVEAVSVLFHISSYKIKVLKMEDSK